MTQDEVANQRIQNGKPAKKEKEHLKELNYEMDQALHGSQNHIEPFTMYEFEEALSHIKLSKAAGIDGITAEMIQHFVHNTKT